jgi:hypothetical protein
MKKCTFATTLDSSSGTIRHPLFKIDGGAIHKAETGRTYIILKFNSYEIYVRPMMLLNPRRQPFKIFKA